MWGAPWSIVAFVVLNLQIPVNAVRSDDFNAGVALSLALIAVLFAFVWRGSRVAWTIVFLLELFAVLVQPFDPSSWWVWALNLIGLILLLWPASREHVWGTGAWRMRAVR